MLKLIRFLSLLIALCAVTATPLHSNSTCVRLPTAGPVSIVTQFPNGTWVENLALRSDGTVLATLYEPIGKLVLIDPAHNGSVETLHTFPNPQTGAGGLVEIGQDVFYFVTATRGSSITDPPAGTGQVWRADMRGSAGSDNGTLPVTLVANLTDSILPNGNTVSADGSTMLVADSQRGVIFGVSVASGAVHVAAADPALRNTTVGGLGVNGIHMRGGYLYFTNSDLGLYARLPVSPAGDKVGAVQVLTRLGFSGVDDFALLGSGSTAAILADDPGNRTVLVTGKSEGCGAVVLAHLNGPTAVKVVEHQGGPRWVYVSTEGGIVAYEQPGPVRVGGTLSRFELKG